eukprot:4202716-Amphidinium_carterae.3
MLWHAWSFARNGSMLDSRVYSFIDISTATVLPLIERMLLKPTTCLAMRTERKPTMKDDYPVMEHGSFDKGLFVSLHVFEVLVLLPHAIHQVLEHGLGGT